MKTNKERYYSVSQLATLRPFLSNPIIALGVHWIFQGMLHMDPTELLFKTCLEAILIVIFLPLLALIGQLPWAWATTVAFVLAHTLNFLFNGQMWVVLKHFGWVRRSRSEFDAYLCQLSDRIWAEPSIEYAEAYGSLVRGEWSSTSDLDVRLVRKSGVINGLRACSFSFRERTRALLRKFPLDIAVFDGPQRLTEMRSDEVPQVMK